MNVVKWLGCVIGVFVFLGGCKQKCEDDPNLTADELSWVNCYNDGQKVTFISDTGSIDTLKVIKYISTDLAGRDEQTGCDHLFQYCQIELNFTPLIISVSHSGKWHQGNVNVLGNQILKYTPQNSITLNNVTYYNVYVMAIDTSNISSSEKGVWKIVYTKKDGLLEYDYWHGLKWVKIN